MANQTIQPVQIKSPSANLYTYNQVNTGFATVNTVQKKEKSSISSIFNWNKKDKIKATEQQPPTFYSTSYHQPTYTVQYAPNYIIDSNRKFMHYKPDAYLKGKSIQSPFPSTIHATIRYLPNHKQRTNILTTNWEPSTYSTAQLINPQQQPVTLQHEITYSEQITIAPTPYLNQHHHHCLAQNQSCNCYPINDNQNYFFLPTNSSLLESSTKLLNKSTDCMILNNKKNSKIKHNSIRGSKSQYNLNDKYLIDENSTGQLVNNKKKGSKLAATVNERFLRIFKKSIKEPFNTVKQRKSILDCDLTAYDLLKSSKENEELINKNDDNLECTFEEEEEEENNKVKDFKNQFENNFKQAKAKQKQHYYQPFKDQETSNQINQNKENLNNINRKDEEDKWTCYPSTLINSKVSKNYQNSQTKFSSCRIAGQGMQLFGKRMSILDSELLKDNLKEELSEEEDLNRFSKYAQNFEKLDKTEKLLNYKLNDNFRLLNKSSSTHNLNNSIPNLPDPDYDDEDDYDDEEDRHTLTMFSRSTPDLDQTTSFSENLKYKKLNTFTNTTSLYNINSLDSYNQPLSRPPLPPLPNQLPSSVNKDKVPISNVQSNSPTSSTYSSFNSAKNSNVKSILKKSNSNLKLFEHLKTVDLLDKRIKKDNKYNNETLKEDETKNSHNRFTSSKLLSTFRNQNKNNNQIKILEDLNKPKKQVHFRSSFNDELIIEHINNNQELYNDDEQIYDDILTTRFKQTNDDKKLTDEEEETKVRKEEEIDNNFKNEDKSESKNFLKFDKNLNNLDKNDYSNQSLDSSIKSEMNKAIEQTSKEDSKFSCTDKINSINSGREKSSFWENQSSQLPKANSFEFRNSKDNNNQFFNLNNSDKHTDGDSNELQSTALIKQNRKKIDNNNSFFEQQPIDNKNKFNTNEKGYNLLQSLTESTKSNMQTNLSSINSFKEDNLFKCNQDTDRSQQQMSPSSSSSTSAYVSLYASSSFSSTGSSSSNYSTSRFNLNEKNGNKISRSAILDAINNRRNNKSTENNRNLNNQSKENKIIIDVSMNNSNNYDSLNQSQTHEHIYEELEACNYEREVNNTDSLNDNLNSIKNSQKQRLEYLEDAKERIQELLINNYNDQYSSQQKFSSLSTSCHNIALTSINRTNRRNRSNNLSNVSSDSSSSSDILITNINNSIGQHLERNDSGVGTETSKPSSLDIRMSRSEACLTELIDNHIVDNHFDDHLDDNEEETLMNKKRLNKSNDLNTEEQLCADCDQNIVAELNEQTGLVYYPLLCSKCDKRRLERKEIIQEFVDTEFKYGRDLRIIREEFSKPIEIAGLLTKEQIKNVFLNLDELIEVNSKFSEKLQDAIDIATEQGDEDYTTVDIGKLFMESCDMIKSFETYCCKQASASRLLGQLEKDKEFLRIFLRVSQMENALLRRMNLSAFLMVPVQRVCRYPLLLNRLYKVTPYHHDDREILKEAQRKVEGHLEQINQQTKGTVSNKIWRRISNLSNNSTSKRSNLDELGDIKLKKFNTSVRELFNFKAFKSRS